MDNNIKSNTSFWSEITEYEIQVPFYQRDYAQGRRDNGRIDNIRKVFVEELFGALKGQNKCHLGLVFGSYNENEKVFIVVDGQQRLTTVFLLHWYVAWHENKLNDYKEKLSKFSWDTRSYSSQFVKLLFNIQPSNKVKVIDAIKTNSNYFSVWENDPTVKGMLTMLKEIESQYPQKDCNLCNSLFAHDCNIQYDILKLEKDSDRKTYLKMNSRGRSLTTFELFKSKFLDKYHPNYGQKFDNEWLIFMLQKFANSNSLYSDPDTPFMNFINEYTYLQLKLKYDSDNANDFKEFTDAKVKGELNDVPFISFDKYNDAFEGNLENFEKSLDWVCQNYENIKLIDDEVRFSGSLFFIDSIIKKDNNLHFSHRAKLFAAFKYAEITGYAPFNTELYKKWTRVFRNLVANTEIDGSNIGGICKTINKIDNSDIYCYLSKGGELTAFTKEQVAEEIAKSKQILDENDKFRKYDGCIAKEDGSNYDTWEEIIIKAEEYAFFKGTIRFLFTKESIGDDWEHFNTKWKNAQEYFDKNDVKDGIESNKKYKTNSLLMKSLLAKCDDFGKKIWWHFEFSNDEIRWKRILTSNNWRMAVDEIMAKGVTDETTNEFINEINDSYIKSIVDDGLMDYVCNEMPGAWIRSTYWSNRCNRYNYHALWQSGYPDNQVVLNPILSKLFVEKRISYSDDNKIPQCRYYKCVKRNVDFMYNCTHYFQWYGAPNELESDVYLMEVMEDERKDYKRRHDQIIEGRPDNENYYCFRVTKEMEENTALFIGELERLIAQARTNDSEKVICKISQEKIGD